MLTFWSFAIVTVLASLLVIGQRNPIHSVLLLIVSFAALAGLYVQLEAPFVAVIQIIIYAGAIMVLFLFVVMLLNAPRERVPEDRGRHIIQKGPRRFGAVIAFLLAVELVWAVWQAAVLEEPWDFGAGAGSQTGASSVAQIGRSLFTDYAFAFEVTSVLILVAMVGAIVLAKRGEQG
jgi:NADH-quinone oxidoreductase subunit J